MAFLFRKLNSDTGIILHSMYSLSANEERKCCGRIFGE